jgi:2-amino-4-hydroxy-6-hydroxymethyldihydropteridine diphosphokinase
MGIIMHEAILSLGSNLDDRSENLKKGIRLIEEQLGKITQVSSLYETAAIGFQSELNFYNICLNVETNRNPEEILDITEAIEVECGRMQKSKNKIFSSRTLDIDIILIGDIIINTSRLTIPHPRYTERKFVLFPLVDIQPFIIDPNLKIIASEILANCKDDSYVKPIINVL